MKDQWIHRSPDATGSGASRAGSTARRLDAALVAEDASRTVRQAADEPGRSRRRSLALDHQAAAAIDDMISLCLWSLG